jgi:ribose transport system substrate-binding protein
VKQRGLFTLLALLVVASLLAACAPAAPAEPAEPEAAEEVEEEEEAAPEEEEEEAAPEEEVEEEEVAAEESYYFVYVPKLVHPWYDDVQRGAQMAMEEFAAKGVEVTYDWDAPTDADVVLHTQRLEGAIAKEPDAIFVSCLDAAADKPLIEEAQNAGIPVMSFDTPCPDTSVEAFIGRYDYEEDGADVAEALAEAIDYEGKVAILAGSPGAANHQQRVVGFKAVMETYPDIEIVAEEFDNDDVERAVNLTASILQANPDLAGIYGCNASNPIGAGRAIVEAGKVGEVVLIGMDDMPDMVEFVKDGTAMAMSVQNVPEIGYWTIKYGVAKLQGHIIPTIHDTGSALVTQDEVDTYKMALAEPKDSYYFAYVPKLVHPWYDAVQNGANDAIDEFAKAGIEVTYDWDAPADADVVLHTQRLEGAIAKEPDVLFVSCLDAAADKPLIEDAVGRGIPTFAFDTPCPDTDVEAFVGRFFYEDDGSEVAEALAEAIDYKGKVAVLAGSPGAANHQQRVIGFKAVMETYPDIEIVAEEFDNDDVERAVNLTASILQAHPDLAGIYGCNASNPIGAGRAIVEAGKVGGVVLIGMDDMPDMIEFVRDGTALAMSVQNVSEIGYWTTTHAVARAQGHTIPSLHDTGSLLVTQDMVDTYK